MTPEQQPGVFTITSGMRVITSDDVDLGAVKEVDRGRFKVNAPYQPDYWLDVALVVATDGNTVILTVPREHLAAYRQEDGEPAP